MSENIDTLRADNDSLQLKRSNYILKSWLNSGFEIIHRRETK